MAADLVELSGCLRPLVRALDEPYRSALETTAWGGLTQADAAARAGVSLRAYAVDDALAADDHALLTDWLRTSTTGGALIRAGVPAGWQVGDKTGAGGYGTRSDIAVLTPPGRAPIVLAVLSSRAAPDAEHDDALIAAATRVTVDALAR